jgi:hypothetical protein
MIRMYRYSGEKLEVVDVPTSEVSTYSANGWYTSEELARDNA